MSDIKRNNTCYNSPCSLLKISHNMIITQAEYEFNRFPEKRSKAPSPTTVHGTLSGKSHHLVLLLLNHLLQMLRVDEMLMQQLLQLLGRHMRRHHHQPGCCRRCCLRGCRRRWRQLGLDLLRAAQPTLTAFTLHTHTLTVVVIVIVVVGGLL